MFDATYGALLRRRDLRALFSTQFLGTLNDNLYKMVVSLLALAGALAVGNGGGGGSAYLSLAGAIFILPYILFSGYAGYVADAFDKRRVMIMTKILEIVIMGLACAALMTRRIDVLLALLFLMATQSVFFSPARYGILPRMVSEDDLPRANGLIEMGRNLAIILGTMAGGVMAQHLGDRPLFIGIILIAIACTGMMISRGVGAAPPKGPRSAFRINPWGEICVGIQRLASERTLWWAVAGITYFEFMGALAMLDILLVAKELQAGSDSHAALLLAITGLGVGIGCFAAGRQSGARLRLVSFGFAAAGVAVALLVLSFVAHSYAHTAVALFFLGMCGGMMIVPLYVLLQHHAGCNEKGLVIATNNFLNVIGVLFACGSLWVLRDLLDVSPDRILLFCAAFAVVWTVAFLSIAPRVRNRRQPLP